MVIEFQIIFRESRSKFNEIIPNNCLNDDFKNAYKLQVVVLKQHFQLLVSFEAIEKNKTLRFKSSHFLISKFCMIDILSEYWREV